MVQIASRSSWGARHDDGDLTLRGLADEVFLHHTVTTQLPATATVEQERAEMRKLEGIGENRFGAGISYNVLVFPSGRAYQGVSFNRRGTHTGGRNSTARSICFVGNYETHEPTPAQLATAAAIVAEGRGKWWVNGAPVRGHRDIKATSCPGRNVYKHRAAIAAGTAGGDARPVDNPKPGPAPVSPRPSTGLTVDGHAGPATIRRWQQVMGTTPDGVISGQGTADRPRHVRLASVKYGRGGSELVRAVQRTVGTNADGYLGPNTIAAVQRRLGVTPDGYFGPATVTALQQRLNTGRF